MEILDILECLEKIEADIVNLNNDLNKKGVTSLGVTFYVTSSCVVDSDVLDMKKDTILENLHRIDIQTKYLKETWERYLLFLIQKNRL